MSSPVRNTILDHLRAGGTLTKIDAIYPPFSTTNLSDKVLILRRAGHNIQKRWKTTADGKRKFAEYFIPQKDQD